jgi:hypothetical protein
MMRPEAVVKDPMPSNTSVDCQSYGKLCVLKIMAIIELNKISDHQASCTRE